MNKIPVIALMVCGLLFAAVAEAAPKKRTRSQNRIGPYGAALVGLTSYDGDESNTEAELIEVLTNQETPMQNLRSTTEDTDLGYQATFGYRFNRYVAGELGLVQFGELVSSASADLDFPGDTEGFVPATVKLSFGVGGPVLSVLGILPVNEKFEVFGRVGYLFASSEREFSSRVDGERGVGGSAKGDSQELIYGLGVAWNINQVYSIRGEYQMLSEVGDPDRSGTEDLNVIGVSLLVRF